MADTTGNLDAGTEQESAKGQPGLTAHAEQTLAAELPGIEQALKRILASFDTRVTPCCTCGMKVAQAYNDKKAEEMFRGTLQRIQRYQERVSATRHKPSR